ncbi:MAG: SBBP repeat-containing protein [Bacteroidota bacterium]|nr:SBBP repeat-containing protein [Bacteroidota bacterium]
MKTYANKFAWFTCILFLPIICISQNTNICFKENKGQICDQHSNPRPDILFSGNNHALNYYLKNNGISYQLKRIDSWKKTEDIKTKKIYSVSDQISVYRLDIKWLNTNNNVLIKKGAELNGTENYYLNSSLNGITNVKSYADITYQNIYNGIDLHYYSKNSELKYDYIIQPNADYKKIQLQIEGAEKIVLQADGSLLFTTPLGNINEEAPIVYQNNKRLTASWIIKNNILSFDVENYDPSLSLLIDPAVRVWGTYYGGSGTSDQGQSCATDLTGNVYLAGVTDSNNNIATAGSFQTTLSSSGCGFLAKFNTNGVRQWATYHQGVFYSCAIDPSSDIFAVGNVGSLSTLSTPGAHQTSFGGGNGDAFVVKFNGSGVRIWATYYGGTGVDNGLACASDKFGNVYLAGITTSSVGTAVATVGSHQSAWGGAALFNDAFLVKFDGNGTRLWGTYYGGTGYDEGYSCVTDSAANVYLAGETTSVGGTVIATAGSHQSNLGGGNKDAFLVKFNSNGLRLWASYYGGAQGDNGRVCVTDKTGNVFLSGFTLSYTGAGISTVGSHQSVHACPFGGTNCFLVKFNSAGVRQWGTYYGGTVGSDFCYASTVDNKGNIYIGGNTNNPSGTSIATPGSHQTIYGGSTSDGFIAKFNTGGVRQWGTLYGGSSQEEAFGCTTDTLGGIFLTGYTVSTNTISIATPGGHQTTSGGGNDAFLVKLFDCNSSNSPTISASSTSNTLCTGQSATLTAAGASTYTWSSGPTGSNVIVSPITSTNYIVTGTSSLCSESATISITVNQQPTTSNAGASQTVCASTATLSGNTPTVGIGNWTLLSGTGTITNQSAANTSITGLITGSNVLQWSISNGICPPSTSTVLINSGSTPTLSITGGSPVICQGTTITFTANGANTYSWNTGATTSIITVTPSTTSTYTVTGMNGPCSSNAVITQTVSLCTGADQYKNTGYEITIYPNPTSGILNLELESNLSPDNLTIEIVSLLGQKIIERHFEKTLDLKTFKNGIYFLQLYDKGKLIATEKIIKE